jgi:hypothetical protein
MATSTMTSKERVLAAMTRQPVDYVPCAPFLNFQDWPQRVGKRWQFPFGPSQAELLDYAVGTLELDQVVNFAGGYYPEAGVSSDVRVEGDILYKRFTTPSGILQASVHLDDAWPHGMDIPFFSDYNPAHFVEPWIASLNDVACLRHILQPPKTDDQLAALRFENAVQQRWADKYNLATCYYDGLGLTGALDIFGPTRLCELAVEDPALVDAYLEVDHQYNLAMYEIALDMGVDCIRRNGFYESADLYSPHMLEQFLGKRLREEVALVHQAGRPIGYTMLSGYAPIIEYLATLGIDCLVCPDVFLRDGDADVLKDKLGAATSFWTGPSDTVHLPWEQPNEVRKAVRYIFETFGKTGLIISPCSSAKAVFPWSNILAMIDEWRELR